MTIFPKFCYGFFFPMASAFATLHGASQTNHPLFVPAPGSPLPVAGSPGNIALGDVNQDNKLDLVVASGGGVTVMFGQGDGRFRIAPGGPLKLATRPTEMILREFNGDGWLDLATANHDSYSVVLLLGDGKGGFAPGGKSEVLMKDGQSPHTHGLNAGDLNGDGKLDLVTVNSEDNDVSIAFGDGMGGFRRAGSSFPVGGSPYPGALADLNRDGHLDIVATSTDRRTPEQEKATRALTALLGDGAGNFRRESIPLRTVLPWFVAVGDLTEDRKPDLVVTHAERNELTILIGDGKGSFSEASGSPLNLRRSAWKVEIADFNGDTKADVAVAAGDAVCVLLGDSKGGFRHAPGSPFTSGKGTWQLAVGDVNGDAKPDITTSNLEADSVTVLLAQ